MSFPSPTEKQAQVIWLAVTGLAIAVILGLVVGAGWGLGRVLTVLAPVVWPLAVAGVVACLLDPVVGFLTRRKVPRLRAIVVVFVLALAIVGAVGASIVPQLVVQSRELATRTSELATQLPEKVAQLAANPPSWLPKQGTELIKSLSTLGKGPGTNEVVAVVPAEVVTNQAVLVAGTAGFGFAIGTHFVEGYVNPVHLGPAFMGAALFMVSILCEMAGARRLESGTALDPA